MLSYDAYLREMTHSQPYVRVYFGGVEVTNRLVRERGIETDTLLDTPELSVYTSALVEIYLTNHDNYFSVKQSPNFFIDNGLDASGWRVPVLIQGGFVGLDPRVFFYGEIEEVFQIPSKEEHHVRVLVLDLSTRLRRALLDNVGESITRNLIGGGQDNPNYSEVNPIYELGVGDLPISRESLTARIGNQKLRVHPSLPRGGLGDYRDVSVDLDRGIFTFGAEPPNKRDTTVTISFKTAYRYRTPEFLVHALADSQGIYAGMGLEEKAFARDLIQSPTLRHGRAKVTGRGRARRGSTRPLVRGISSDLNGIYLCGDRVILKYERRGTIDLDTYSVMGTCPDTDATLLEIIQHSDNFYLLSTASLRGHLTSKIWRFSGTTWTELAGSTSGFPTTSHPYDYATKADTVSGADPVSDNRKSFLVHDGFLYFVFGNNDPTHKNGVQRINLADDTIERVFSRGPDANYGIDFIIHNNQLYVFVCQRGAGTSNHLRFFRMGLDGASPTEIYTEQFDRADGFYPATVSDVVYLDNQFFFVFSQHRTVQQNGKSELCRIAITGGTRHVIREYDNVLYGARSLSVYKNRVYWVEGQWLISLSGKLYPTFSDAGRIDSCDTFGMLGEGGGAWQSAVDTVNETGYGMHTAFPSNLWHDNLTDSLFFIAGYGLPIDLDVDSISTVDSPITRNLENWVWLQFGRNLATRIPLLQTNGRSTWELMSELARTVDWEIGFTEAHADLETFYASNPTVERFEPRQYLFFRPKSARPSSLVIDGSVNVEVGGALDTTLILNHIVVPYGDGVWTERDPDLSDGDRVLSYLVQTSLLSVHDEAWAEILAKTLLERQRVPRNKVSVLLKFAPHLEPGQYIEITSERNSFDRVPFQLTQVEQFSEAWQTRIEAREITVATDEVTFDSEVFDSEVFIGATVSVNLPTASGGLSPLTYSMEGLPDGVTFTASPPSYSGRVTVLGVSEVTYTATDSSDPARTARVRFRIAVRDKVIESVALAIPGLRGYLFDNRADGARVFNLGVDEPAREIDNDLTFPGGDYFDATATLTHLIGLDKSGTSDRLRFFLITDGTEDGAAIDLDADRQTGEPRGDWRGVAFNSTDNLIYVMNNLGIIRTYNLDRTQNPSIAVNLGLCSDWQAIEFRVEGAVDTFLTLTAGLPVALGWDLSQGSEYVARFPAKDVVLHETILGWTGIAHLSSGRALFACRKDRSEIWKYDL